MAGGKALSLGCVVWLLLCPAVPVSAAEGRDSPSRVVGLVLRALPADDLEEIEDALGIRCGVEVTQVAAGSPAASAGLRSKDILIAVADQAVDSPAAVDRILAGKAGKVDFTALRPAADAFEPVMGSISIPAAKTAPPPEKAPVPAAPADVQEKLKAIEAAHDAGVLSDEEYAQKKATLLKGAAQETAPATGGAAGSEYRDPLGRFEMPQPDGWTAQAFPNGQGASLTRGEAAISAMVIPGSRTAAELLASVVEQTRKQWKDYRETGREPRTIAGRDAQTVAFGGVSPKGADTLARIAALAAPETGLVLVLTAPAGEFGAAEAAWKKVLDGIRMGDAGALGKKGKTYRHAIGFSFRYPADWTVKEHPEFIQLIPPEPGSSSDGATEVYFIIGESVAGEGIRAADDPRVAEYLEEQVRSVAPALRRTGAASPVPMAKGTGMLLAWEGKSPNGDVVRALAFATIISENGVALIALGLDDRIRKRDADLRQMFASFGFGESQKDPRLVGGWLYEKSFWAGTYSSTTIRTLTLRPDGTFTWTGQFFGGMDHTDAGGAVEGRTSGASDRASERGRWGASGGKLYLFFDDGSYAEYGYHVEDQSDGRAMLLQTADGGKQLWTQKK
ncbi:MAG: hypothetical protein JXP34_11245 [Planctomycetes bacterium]|nr:hypothetical protein [Planctomycetota bacterium]